MIDGKSFFDTTIKNKEASYEKIIELSKNNDYPTINLLDYDYFSKHYKLIAIDLSKQIELEHPDIKQKINFIGRLDRDIGATIVFIIEKSEEMTSEFSQNSVTTFWFSCVLHIKTETQKIVNLLNDLSSYQSKFATKRYYVINSESNGNYAQENPIKFLANSIESSLFDYSDAYIIVTGNIAVGVNAVIKIAFKNCTPFKILKQK